MFDKPPDFKPPQNLDPRVIGMVGCGIVVLILTALGDQVTFVRPPANVGENLATLLPVLGYKIMGERIYADLIAGLIYAAFFAVLVISAFQFWSTKIAMPRMIKKMTAERRREKELVNKYGGDDLI